MMTTATVIAAVHSQPNTQSGRDNVKAPITRFCIAMTMIHDHERHRDDSVHDSAPEQRFDRVEVNKVDEDADQCPGDDSAVERLSVPR